MNRLFHVLLNTGLAVALLLAARSVTEAAEKDATGAVYVATNAAEGNEVVAFKRGADGALTRLGGFLTGGKGTGIRKVPKLEEDNGIDSLISSGSVKLSHNGHFLFVVNAGSGTVTSFVVNPNCELALADTKPSGGTLPNSIAVHGDLLYVANIGQPAKGESANVSGFRVGAKGQLTPIPESTRMLSDPEKSQPAQALFSPKGDFLLVTELMTNKITVFRVGDTGALSKPSATASPGKNPFGACFVGPHLIVCEEQGGAKMGGKEKASASSYTLGKEGDLTLVSRSVGSGRTAACWVSVGAEGRYGLVSNADDGTISSYRIDPADGKLELLKAVAEERPAKKGPTSGPIDAGTSRDGQFFYQLYAGRGEVAAFRVGKDGSLTPIKGGDATGLPVAAGMQGLAAR